MTDRTPTGVLRVRLRTALETEPHLSADDVVTTVMQLLIEQHGDLRVQLAAAIREHVRISPGPNAFADLNAGRPIAISGGEADAAALAVLPVVQAAFAERDTELEQLRTLYNDACRSKARITSRLAATEATLTHAQQRPTGLRQALQVELREAITAQGQAERRAEAAEAAAQRIREMAETAITNAEKSFSRMVDGTPFPASVPADKILSTLDQPEEAQ